MQTFTYRAVFEPGDDPDVTVVTFPDVPEAITEGTGAAEAATNAADALGLALLAYARQGRPLPAPAHDAGVAVTVEPEVAAKLVVLAAFAEAGISKSDLAERLGKDEKEVRRILDPMHPTKIGTLADAARALGHRLVIGAERIAA